MDNAEQLKHLDFGSNFNLRIGIGRRLTIQRGNRNQLEIPQGLSGAYILRVLFEDGNSVVQKVIIHD